MKTQYKKFLWLVAVVLATAARSFAHDGAQNTAETSGIGAPDAGVQNYRLSQNDLIYIKVFGEDDLNGTLRISEDGTITFPLIGLVRLGGRTVQEGTKAIRDLLSGRFLINPQVTLTVLGYANRNVTVLGQVQKPGFYSMKDQGAIDLLQAVGLAGGFTRLANPARITVKRSISGHEKVIVLDGTKMARDSVTAPFVVLPGDTVTIAERMF